MQLKTIYELLCDFSEIEINTMIQNLSEEERELLQLRYGNDLHNPITSDSWTRELQNKFYKSLIPKMKRILYTEKVKSLNKMKAQASTMPQDVLELLKEKKNHYEICKELNINNEELNRLLLQLKNMGLTFTRNYYSNGTIRESLINRISQINLPTANQDKIIITDTKETSMKFLLISDLHCGNLYERNDLFDRAFNYCKKQGIHVIFCCGDFLDGTFTKGCQLIPDVYQQFQYFIKTYPFDPHIITFGVGGDHDVSIFGEKSLNFIQLCENYRPDVVIGGYNNAIVRIKNDKIQLYHPFTNGQLLNVGASIILRGHPHKQIARVENHILDITVSTLSSIKQPLPTAIELSVDFQRGYFKKAYMKQIYFGPEDIILSEVEFDDFDISNKNTNFVKNIEPYKSSPQRTLGIK